MTLIKISKIPRTKRTWKPEKGLHKLIGQIREGLACPKIEHENGFIRLMTDEGRSYMLTEEHYKKLLDPPPIGGHISIRQYVQHDGRTIKVRG